MRTIEVLIVIVIITGAFISVSAYTALPWPREVSPVDLKELSLTTLEILDSNYDLSKAAFDTDNTTLWMQLQSALSAALPANVVYNLTVYEIDSNGGTLYNYKKYISNADNLGLTSDASSYMVASSNVTFNVIPEKIGESSGGTLYILNCSDANGWWITGYTAQSLAGDLYKMLSPYFVKTVVINNTAQLEQILYNVSLTGETVQNAVIINTCGEAVPIPSAFCNLTYSSDYARYCHFLGQKTSQYNWTWCSIVGYPFYYVCNTATLTGENGYGIYGMSQIGPSGSRAFLLGLDNPTYTRNTNGISDSVDRQVTLTQEALDACNYYGIYPSPYQTSTRALSGTILSTYHLQIGFNVFNPDTSTNYYPGTLFNHVTSGTITGSFLALGLTRTPDIRITALGLLSYYQPRLYRSEYTSGSTSRVVILQLGLLGGE